MFEERISKEADPAVPHNHGALEGPVTQEDYQRARSMNPDEIARNVFELRQKKQAREQIWLDKKSGLMTDNYYIEEYGKLLDRLNSERRRANDPDGAFQLMFDIRRMHDINNRLGGQVAGDRAIETVGELLRETFRMGEGDILARTGGDEFTVVTPYLFHTDETGKILAPDDVKSILMRRLEDQWMKLVHDGTADFELLVHIAPVERGKSMRETKQDADPKNNYDQALVFGEKIEPFPIVDEREKAKGSPPKRQNSFSKIFVRRN